MNPYIVINYKIPHSEVSFFKQDSVFIARYISVLTIKQDGQQIGGESNRKEIVVKDYSMTLATDEYSEGVIKKEIKKGDYDLSLNIWDLQSNKKWDWEREITIESIEGTDIGSMQWLSGPSYIISTDDTVRIKVNIFNNRESGITVGNLFRSRTGNIYYEDKKEIDEKGINLLNIEIPAKKFPEGIYEFEVVLRDNKGDEFKKKSFEFSIRLPFFRSSRYYQRVKQLEYIANPDEMRNLLNAPVEDREELWEDFWRKRDPTSDEEVNEFKNEYFRRIDYAQSNFSTGLTEGWKSDRGKIYVLLGPPDYIERHPFEMESKAYQIWYYYNRGYRLIFEEKYNLGEYELKNPPRGLE